MTRDQIEKLKAMRQSFLGEAPQGTADYWSDPETLQLYDTFYGARIAWKWQAVLGECQARGLQPEGRPQLFDWGCGTGRASRTVLSHFGIEAFGPVVLWDRSALALKSAGTLLQTELGATTQVSDTVNGNYWLLVSHTLGELAPGVRENLLRMAERAQVVLWVEPGTYRASRELGKVRETLRARLTPIAPCPHSGPCGVFSPENELHWCHHFARSQSTAFHSAQWSEFSREVGIDLRSLPYSYLVLSKTELPRAAHRTLGRARMHKADADLLQCQADGKVSEVRLFKRDDPALFKRLKHGEV